MLTSETVYRIVRTPLTETDLTSRPLPITVDAKVADDSPGVREHPRDVAMLITYYGASPLLQGDEHLIEGQIDGIAFQGWIRPSQPTGGLIWLKK